MGVSVESQAHAGRVDELRAVPAAVRFVSGADTPALAPGLRSELPARPRV